MLRALLNVPIQKAGAGTQSYPQISTGFWSGAFTQLEKQQPEQSMRQQPESTARA